ncbi:MAG: hypothetical protein ABI687_12970, partial [Flavitalea sp.]
MESNHQSRREFIRHNSLTALGLAFLPPLSEIQKNDFFFLSPIDGDMLHRYDGIMLDEQLQTLVKLRALQTSNIMVNGVNAKYRNGISAATIPLSGYKSIIQADDPKKHSAKKIEVYLLKNFAGKYRVSVDDAIWFLKDIYTHTTSYTSIFDNPYLKFLKQLHDDHGTKVH